MRILICGASGFVGSNLCRALQARGHECIRGLRRPSQPGDIAIDYRRDTDPSLWHERLQGIDVVISAIGVLRDTRRQPMQALQAEAPAALFRAAAETGVQRIVNISALGVDSGLETEYFRTKAAAEQVLFSLPAGIHWLNLRPSVIYGENGASARMFRLQASLPLHTLPMGGRQLMQPVHIDDLCEAVGNWLEAATAENISIEVAGSEVVTMRAMLDSYRSQLGHGAALHVPVPALLMTLAAKIGNLLPMLPLCDDTLLMLEAGSTGDNSQFAQLLGKRPMGVSEFIAHDRGG